MNIFKSIFNFFKSFFVKAKDFEPSRKKRNPFKRNPFKRNRAPRRLSNKEKLYNWLSSTGYTPAVNVSSENDKETPMTHFKVMMLHAKMKGRKLRSKGVKIIRKPENKNRHGLDIFVYFKIDKEHESSMVKKKNYIDKQKLKLAS